MKKFAAMALAVLSGCAAADPTTSRPVAYADGQAGYLVDCSLATRGQTDCATKASALCPVGYYVRDIGTATMSIRCKGSAAE